MVVIQKNYKKMPVVLNSALSNLFFRNQDVNPKRKVNMFVRFIFVY